jgi:hypothetical protein
MINLRFRWLECQLAILNKLRTEKDIRHALTVLPRTLFESYDRLLESINEQYADVVSSALFLVIHTIKPLSLGQIVEGIAPVDAAGYLDYSASFADPSLLLYECGALLMHKDGYWNQPGVHLCHYTVEVNRSTSMYLYSRNLLPG